MNKAAAPRKTTTKAGVDIERWTKAASAKQQFATSTLDMGWQMALMVLIPVLLGVWLDSKFNSSPSLTLAALVVAISGSAWVIYKTVNDVNKKYKG
jgi:predicted Na+-dependent transporter